MISRVRELILRISTSFKRRRLDDDLDQELATHLSLLTDQFLRKGMSKEEATYAARCQFGGIAQVKQELYEIHGFFWIQTVLRDVQHAVQWLWKNPGFTATAVGTLALGIASNTAIFSVVNTILLKPMNAPDPDRVIQFEDVYSGSSTATVSPQEFNIWRKQTSVFQDVSAHWLDHLNLTGTSNPELIPAARVTADFFRLYGAPVLHGGFDRYCEEQCREHYHKKLGRPSLAPGVYFRLMLIGFFEGIGSERGIAWRIADSLSLRPA